MGTYKEDLEWDPDKLTTWIAPTAERPGRVAWSAVGLVDIEYARKFAHDLLAKCNQIEELEKEHESNYQT